MKRLYLSVLPLALLVLLGGMAAARAENRYALVDYAGEWRTFDQEAKLMMVECFHTGIAIFIEEAHTRDSRSLEFNAAVAQDYGTFEYHQIIALVDQFYAQPPNSNIPIPHALNIAILRHNHRSTDQAWKMATRTKTYRERE